MKIVESSIPIYNIEFDKLKISRFNKIINSLAILVSLVQQSKTHRFFQFRAQNLLRKNTNFVFLSSQVPYIITFVGEICSPLSKKCIYNIIQYSFSNPNLYYMLLIRLKDYSLLDQKIEISLLTFVQFVFKECVTKIFLSF